MRFKVNIDNFDRTEWERCARQFTDYSIYQTWPYQQVRAEMEGQEISRAIVKDENDNVVVMCQVRIKHVELLGLKIGYIQSGPLLLMKVFQPVSAESALIKLRQEYIGKKVNILRIVPNIFKNDANNIVEGIMTHSGFHKVSMVPNFYTMLLSLTDEEQELRQKLHRSWRRYLRKAEQNDIEIWEGNDIEYFNILKELYILARKRKQFKGLDPDVFIRTQNMLSESENMNVVIACFQGKLVAAHITSHLGDTAVGILAACNDDALKCYATYLVWWRTFLAAKRAGMKQYDLSGIDPKKNPKVYEFKSRMGGEDAYYVGAFEATSNTIVKNLWHIGERIYRLIKKRGVGGK